MSENAQAIMKCVYVNDCKIPRSWARSLMKGRQTSDIIEILRFVPD